MGASGGLIFCDFEPFLALFRCNMVRAVAQIKLSKFFGPRTIDISMFHGNSSVSVSTSFQTSAPLMLCECDVFRCAQFVRRCAPRCVQRVSEHMFGW